MTIPRFPLFSVLAILSVNTGRKHFRKALLSIIKNEQTEPNLVYRFYLLLKTSKHNLTFFIAFIYY